MATTTTPTPFLLCVVTNGRPEVSLVCSVSLLRFQTTLMTAPERLRADMHVVDSFDDAMNALHASPDALGALVIDGSMGFDAEFGLRALRSGKNIVVGSYPLPGVDWQRVKERPTPQEDPKFWGHVYSATLADGGKRDQESGYAAVKGTQTSLGLAWVSKSLLTDIATSNPQILTSDKTQGAFAVKGVYAGTRLDANQRFLSLATSGSLQGVCVWADLDHPAISTGPMEFGGCVGARSVLR